MVKFHFPTKDKKKKKSKKDQKQIGQNAKQRPLGGEHWWRGGCIRFYTFLNT